MAGKKKLAQYAEIKALSNVIEVPYEEAYNKKHKLRGTWSSEIFLNENPIVLELGCGKGEYSVGMARNYPEKNFIGMDIKGARMWRGAKTANEEEIENVRFLRTRIEFIDSFFEEGEVSEIWITFPDPQPQLSKEKKRLTAPIFLDKYFGVLKKGGAIHLKTDAISLYEYSLEIALSLKLDVEIATNQLYKDLFKLKLSEKEKTVLKIPTFYEQKFIEKGHEICYLKFKSPNHE